jgi:exopolysaccharide biosynthesis polyprenyl glycosylphosphotransferase
VIFVALVLGYQLRFHSGFFPLDKGIPPLVPYLNGFGLIAVFWFGVLMYGGFYARARPFSLEYVFELVRLLLVGAGLGMVAAFLYRGFSYSRLAFVIGFALTAVCLSAWHLVKARLRQAAARGGVGAERTAIVGDGVLARDCARKMLDAQSPFLRLLGYIGKRDGLLDGVVPELGAETALLDLVRDHELDRVVIALPSAESERILALIRQLDLTSVQVTLIPDLFGMLTRSVEPGDLNDIPAVTVSRLPIHGFGGQVKHLVDFFAASVGLLAISPFLAFVALLVRRDKGPAFYTQTRIGLDGRTFEIIKFRSMKVDAEAETGPKWADVDDPRCTRLGKWLRKYSIDELPQLVNVIRGEMSLVGPRPERPEFVEKFQASIPHYMARHKVRSGITGWAQISGLRGQSPIEDRTRYDIWYIENWSLWLDLKILIKTIWIAFIRPTGG